MIVDDPLLLADQFGFGIVFLAVLDGVYTLLVGIAIWWLIWSSRGTSAQTSPKRHRSSSRASLYEGLWVILMIGIFTSLTIITFPWAPPVSNASSTPAQYVSVTAFQFGWSLNTTNVKLNVPVEFILQSVANPGGGTANSVAVNHDFGVYSSNGELIGQTQVIPGKVNKIVLVFKTPGTYYIRCLEYCGFLHYEMVSQFTVS
jgi:cytochrome c oxidase subunit 2